ncbi:MAG: NAD(+)/NADH kinase [Spirochaetaceae bacterium]|jgi:NAD+ kinase|nr:NAD(+)/NADH kinase [Spirochaetaceae bacterium]
MKVLLIINTQKSAASTLASEIKDTLAKRGCDVKFYSFDGDPAAAAGFDIAFSLGGDGTVLFAARTIAAFGTPVIPVNLGTFGFTASVHPSQWDGVFSEWAEGKRDVSERLMLEVRVKRGGATVFSSTGLNDAVISSSGIAKTIRLEAWMEDMHIGNYRSDGLIVATPTGSTAYSSSAGGPIIDPEIEAFILNPICPFTLVYRPIVLPAGRPITIKVCPEQRSGVILTIDGQVTETLEPDDLVVIKRNAAKARLVACDRAAFYSALHSKLGFVASGTGTRDA